MCGLSFSSLLWLSFLCFLFLFFFFSNFKHFFPFFFHSLSHQHSLPFSKISIFFSIYLFPHTLECASSGTSGLAACLFYRVKLLWQPIDGHLHPFQNQWSMTREMGFQKSIRIAHVLFQAKVKACLVMQSVAPFHLYYHGFMLEQVCMIGLFSVIYFQWWYFKYSSTMRGYKKNSNELGLISFFSIGINECTMSSS